MKIALVHEFLNQLGGAERVLENFLEIWPDATVHVLIFDQNKTGKIFGSHNLKTSFLDKCFLSRNHHRWLLPLMPMAVESFDFQDYDVVISDSSSFAKGAKSKGKLHICYCHTPTRFLWTESEKYVDSQKGSWLTKKIAKTILPSLRKWDLKASQRPSYFIANSINVQNRIKKYYNRDSEVIYPPVDTSFFQPQGKKGGYFFTASRLEPYKKIDLVVETFNKLGWSLKISGVGTQLDKLKSIAKPNIEFFGRVSDEDLRKMYSESKAFIFPAEEDAGIMVLEAQACGTPVIAYRAGGSLETIIEGETGEFFDKQTVESLEIVLKNFNSSKYDRLKIRTNGLKFDKKIFQKNIKGFIEQRFQEFRKTSNS
jgi:glycosyltransferase involved in cell wall biosynthesis